MWIDFFRDLNWSMLINPAMRLIPLIICITVHELSHGYAAFKLGDPTAKMMGRLTLNPIKHIDPIGALMILVVGFGWAKPVPVDMRYFKNPKRDMAITALAGPLSNILTAVFVLIILALIGSALTSPDMLFPGEFFINSIFSIVPGSTNEFIYQIITRTAWLSFILAIFNLLPIPPLDGSKILFSFLPDTAHDLLMRYERYGFVILIGLLFLTDIFSNTVIRLALVMISATSYLFGIIPDEVYVFLMNR